MPVDMFLTNGWLELESDPGKCDFVLEMKNAFPFPIYFLLYSFIIYTLFS